MFPYHMCLEFSVSFHSQHHHYNSGVYIQPPQTFFYPLVFLSFTRTDSTSSERISFLTIALIFSLTSNTTPPPSPFCLSFLNTKYPWMFSSQPWSPCSQVSVIPTTSYTFTSICVIHSSTLMRKLHLLRHKALRLVFLIFLVPLFFTGHVGF